VRLEVPIREDATAEREPESTEELHPAGAS
jgi:hypothetical protein